MKLFQYDKKVWCGGDTNHTLQFGIIRNRTLLHIIFESPDKNCRIFDGLIVSLFLFHNSPFNVDFQAYNCSLSFSFLSEYFEGWGV